ncbi:PSME4 [Lepeophtheirus salmonis]|uniref:PSME4 n=1 Tax=Lepeophtheirus salmonis TaxID=72036 RepID=A0A7R8D773_LEPSM|nr:PSME4 [Lepeophtheirus salmonis]CAF2997355.1 PSME4 [Lepeophtheirus salmonis]
MIKLVNNAHCICNISVTDDKSERDSDFFILEEVKEFESPAEVLVQREKELGFKAQAENIYNSLLPYSQSLDCESSKWLANLKSHLGEIVGSRDVYYVFYEFVTTCRVDYAILANAVNLLSSLLYRRYLIESSELTLNWRPLYDLFNYHFCSSSAKHDMFQVPPPLRNGIRVLIRYAQPYFPPGATVEILQTLKPLMCPLDVTSEKAIDMFQIFLILHTFKGTSLCSILDLLKIISEVLIGNPILPLLFSKIQRIFALPVGYKNVHVGIQSYPYSANQMQISSRWIVATMGGKESQTQAYLNKMFKSLESYFHPTNVGPYSTKLMEFLARLCLNFVRRLRQERSSQKYWGAGIHEKGQVLPILATLRPQLIIPDLVERMNTSLEALTEPHKLTASIAAIASVARPLVSSGAKPSSFQEEGLIYTWVGTAFQSIMFQASSDIFEIALKKLEKYIKGKILEHKVAGKLAAGLCYAVTRANPKKGLPVFLTDAIKNIKSIISSHDGILQQENTNTEIMFNLRIIFEVIYLNGYELLSYVNELLSSLSLVYPLEYRLIPHEYDDTNKLYLNEWGISGDIHDLKLHVHDPTDEEMECVQRLVNKFIGKELCALEEFASGARPMPRTEVKNRLNIIKEAIVGAAYVLPTWTHEEHIKLVPSLTIPAVIQDNIIVHSRKLEVNLNGENVRWKVIQVLDKLQSRLIMDEDDTKSLNLIIRIYYYVQDDFGIRKDQYNAQYSAISSETTRLENKLLGKKANIRSILIEQVMLQHFCRISESMHLRFTETHLKVMNNLLKLSTSKYHNVRIIAQDVLIKTMNQVLYSYTKLIPSLVQILKDSKVTDEQLKGALFLIKGSTNRSLISKHNWEVQEKLWQAIIDSPVSSKNSIISLMENGLVPVVRNCVSFMITSEIPDSFIQFTNSQFKENGTFHSGLECISDSDVKSYIESLNKKNDQNAIHYNNLVNSLTDTIELGNIHWRSKNHIHFHLPLDTIAGDRTDNEWLCYDPSNLPDSEEQWDRPKYVHKTHYGYNIWAKDMTVYAPYAQQPKLDRSRDEPHLERLVNDNRDSYQRCACEIIAGIIRGAKHWNYTKTKNMYSWLIPLIRIGLEKVSPDSTFDWGTCFATSSESRDPNKIYWVLKVLMEEPIRSQGSFIDSSRLYVLQGFLSQQEWRIEVLPQLQIVIEESETNNTSNVTLASDSIESSELQKGMRLLQTVSKFVTCIITRGLSEIRIDYFNLLPMLCVHQANSFELSLAQDCTDSLAALSQSILPSNIVPEWIQAMEEKTSTLSSWKARLALLEFLQVSVFCNFPLLTSREEWTIKICNMIVLCLKDKSIEVREKGSFVLSGLIHSDFITENKSKELLKSFFKRAKSRTNEDDSIIKRHSGVLGLCAFVSAYPYDVPECVPDILVVLSDHLHDSQPIPDVIRRTMQDFKRTHQSNWEECKLKFTEDQFSVFSDISVSPSYYA